MYERFKKNRIFSFFVLSQKRGGFLEKREDSIRTETRNVQELEDKPKHDLQFRHRLKFYACVELEKFRDVSD